MIKGKAWIACQRKCWIGLFERMFDVGTWAHMIRGKANVVPGFQAPRRVGGRVRIRVWSVVIYATLWVLNR